MFKANETKKKRRPNKLKLLNEKKKIYNDSFLQHFIKTLKKNAKSLNPNG